MTTIEHCLQDYVKLRSITVQKKEDPTLASLFAKEESQDREAKEPWDVHKPRGGRKARASGSILQAALTRSLVGANSVLPDRDPIW